MQHAVKISWVSFQNVWLTEKKQPTIKPLNIRRTTIGNTLVDHSDAVGAEPVGAAPTTSSFST